MWRSTRTRPKQRGFTLLETLVALAVFAVACAMAYSGLNAVIASKSALDGEIRFWRDLGLVFDRMENDFLQTLPHGFRSTGSVFAPPFLAGILEPYGFDIELSRIDGERSPVRTLYRCIGDELRLGIAPINDQAAAPGESPRAAAWPLLRNLERCEAAYLGADDTWLAAWPGTQSSIKPRAIRIRLTVAGRGQFERVFYLP